MILQFFLGDTQEQSSSSLDLYIMGILGTTTNDVNLFVNGGTAPSVNGTLPLSVYGATTNTAIGALPLYIEGEINSASLNLFVAGGDGGGLDESLNLFINGVNNFAQNTLPLFVENTAADLNDFIYMFVKGDGITPGYAPINDTLNLFIQRGLYDGITLFLANYQINNNIPLFIQGAPVITNNVDMFLLGEGGSPSGVLDLYVNGGIFTSINSNIDLVMPETVAEIDNSIKLYTHGFNYN